MQVWIVGQFRQQTPHGNVWDFQGVFDSRAGAAAACRTSNYFIAPCDVNSELPPQTESWPGAEYPAA